MVDVMLIIGGYITNNVHKYFFSSRDFSLMMIENEWVYNTLKTNDKENLEKEICDNKGKTQWLQNYF